jgi:histone-lysine N-methyltransferase SETD3
VPLVDMLNHRRPKQTSWSYSNEKQGFVIESLENIKKGEQIYDSYGKKCNSRFFLHYGFIVTENDGNEVALKVNFNKDDPLLQLKEQFMGEKMEKKTFRIMANFEENNVLEFFGFIRFTELSEKEHLLKLFVKNALSKMFWSNF